MKVTCVEKVKFAPGKWEEAGNLMKKFKEAWEGKGLPPVKTYGCISGGDAVQTLFFMTEWDSFGAMESMMEHMFADAEMRGMMLEWSKVVDSHEISILKELSDEELGI